MEKPFVFLSHSKKDINFIRKIDTDLRKCKIETWLDEIDIQHGENWLNAIFENGIEKCDFVFVYLTNNTLNSKMVQNEIDSTFISQLKDNNIKLLPYVDSELTRSKLRSDLQILQIPEINENNYHNVFPLIIANIWNIYLNKVIFRIRKEKNLEIENLKLINEIQYTKASFMKIHEEEFNLFIKEYNKTFTINCIYTKKNKDNVDSIERNYQMNMIFALLIIYYRVHGDIDEYEIIKIIMNYIDQNIEQNTSLKEYDYNANLSDSFIDKLTIFGFITRYFNPDTGSDSNYDIKIRFIKHNYEIFLKSEKFDRFILWLKLNKLDFDKTIVEL